VRAAIARAQAVDRTLSVPIRRRSGPSDDYRPALRCASHALLGEVKT